MNTKLKFHIDSANAFNFNEKKQLADERGMNSEFVAMKFRNMNLAFIQISRNTILLTLCYCFPRTTLNLSIFLIFLTVSEGSGGARKVEESGRKHFHLISSESDHRTPNIEEQYILNIVLNVLL